MDHRSGGAWSHGMAEVAPDLRLHYVTAGSGARTVVLLHGFPQTWWEWRDVLPVLAGAGFRVLALDYRGAGQSWRPKEGYDKRTMARDLASLLRDHLRITGPVDAGRLLDIPVDDHVIVGKEAYLSFAEQGLLG